MSAEVSPTVYVGIVAYNSLEDLPACFAALAAQVYPAIRIIVLDNASTDGSADWVESHAPQARLIRNSENLGFGRGHNQIIQRCQPGPDDFYMPLNPDVKLTPHYIAALEETLRRTGAGWGTGKLLLINAEGTPTGQIYSAGHALRRDGYAVNIGYGMPDDGRFDAEREVFGAPGAAPLIRGSLIAALAQEGDLFDPGMFLYGEDCDLDWRARRQGWRCWYTPQAVAYHRGSRAQGALQVEALGNRYLSVLKNAYMLDLLTYNLPLMAAHCLLRLVLTPHVGIRLAEKLLRQGLKALRKRQRPAMSHAEMLAWFRWSLDQPSGQPATAGQRFRAFVKDR